MRTATVCIGNSDDKLAQTEWHKFITEVRTTVARFTKAVYFEGFPNSDSQFQNACWVICLEDEHRENFEYTLKLIRQHYNQDSIAVIYGETQFI